MNNLDINRLIDTNVILDTIEKYGYRPQHFLSSYSTVTVFN